MKFIYKIKLDMLTYDGLLTLKPLSSLNEYEKKCAEKISKEKGFAERHQRELFLLMDTPLLYDLREMILKIVIGSHDLEDLNKWEVVILNVEYIGAGDEK